MTPRYVITIDGPNAVGKTAAAAALARLLDYRHVNTGALYRAVAYVARELGLTAQDADRIAALVPATRLELEPATGAVLVNGVDRTAELYTAAILTFTSELARQRPIRAALLPVQRQAAAGGGVVVEGRDGGTVVFPRADWKFFLDCADWRKAERVQALLGEDERRRYPTPEAILEHIHEIDRQDRARAIAPLRRAEDAIFHDTTRSPSAEHDAAILYHYIVGARNILDNTEILRRKLLGRPLG